MIYVVLTERQQPNCDGANLGVLLEQHTFSATSAEEAWALHVAATGATTGFVFPLFAGTKFHMRPEDGGTWAVTEEGSRLIQFAP